MNSKIKAELNLITTSIHTHTRAIAIYLFGSYAYGQPTQDSDLDIYVVVPDTENDTLELGAKIHHDLYKKKTIPLDLLIGKKTVFDKRKERLTLESAIAKEGIKIYGN
jgi:predicted nucleotidyltransferase